MGFLASLIGAIATGIQWLFNANQRKLGREQQENDDVQATIAKLEAEKDAASQRPSASDSLQRHDF